jgi:hypothetical protein
MRTSAALVALFCSMLVAEGVGAQDQTWLNDRRYREGIGFRVGDFELHPGIGVDFGYDSNYLLRHANEGPLGTLRLRASPSFSVSTLGPQRREEGPPPTVGFRADLTATYNEFFPVSGTEAERDQLRAQRDIGGDLSLALDILPGREWSGNLKAGVGRAIRPTQEAQPTEDFNRILPQGSAEIAWTPGSGLLDWRLGYGFSATVFESDAFAPLNSLRHDANTRGRWRFLPRTAFMYDGKFSFITYPNPSGVVDPKVNSFPMRSRVGINGLVTNSFAVLALVGWGASFYQDDTQDFDSIIGQLELKWYLTPSSTTDPMKVSATLSSISVGFIRDFEDSYIGNYFEKDQGFARFSYFFGGTFLLSAEAAAGAVVFPTQRTFGPGGAPLDGFTDLRVDGKLFGEYRFTDFFGLNAEVAYTGYISSTTLVLPAPALPDQLGYHDIRAFLGVRLFL